MKPDRVLRQMCDVVEGSYFQNGSTCFIQRHISKKQRRSWISTCACRVIEELQYLKSWEFECVAKTKQEVNSSVLRPCRMLYLSIPNSRKVLGEAVRTFLNQFCFFLARREEMDTETIKRCTSVLGLGQLRDTGLQEGADGFCCAVFLPLHRLQRGGNAPLIHHSSVLTIWSRSDDPHLASSSSSLLSHSLSLCQPFSFASPSSLFVSVLLHHRCICSLSPLVSLSFSSCFYSLHLTLTSTRH